MRTKDRRIDFAGNCITESTVYFFRFYPQLHFKRLFSNLLHIPEYSLDFNLVILGQKFRKRSENEKVKVNGLYRDHPQA